MRKLSFLLVIAVFLFPSLVFAQHNHHNKNNWYLSIQEPGLRVTIGNPPPPSVIFYQQTPQVYYQEPPPVLRQVRVCTPVYLVQTPSGLAQQQRCWMEWR